MSAGIAPIRLTLSAVDKATASVTKLQRRIDGLTAPVRRINRGMARLNRAGGFDRLFRATRRVGSSLGGVATAVGRVAGKLFVVGGVAGVAAIATLRSFAAEGDRLAKLSARTDFGVERLQELAFGAERSGASVADLNKGLEGFARRIGETKANTGTLVTLLKRSNPALLEQLKTSTSSEAAFDAVARAIAKETDQTKRAALANAAFGRQGIKLLNFLQEGEEGINRYAEEARRLGVIIGGEAAAEAEAFEDRLTDLTTALTGVRNTIGAELLPVVTPLIGRLTELVVANREVIATKVDEFMARLPGLFERGVSAARALWEGLQPVINAGKFLVDNFGVVKVVLGGLALLVAVTILPPLIALAGAIFTLFGALFSVAGLVTGVVVGGLVLLASKWDELGEVASLFASNLSKEWDRLGRETRAFWDDLTSFITDKVTMLVNLPGRVASSVGSFFGFGDDDVVGPAATPSRSTIGRSGPVRFAAPAGAASAARAEVSGRLEVQVSDDRVRVRNVQSSTPLFEIEAEQGPSLVGAG